MPSIRRTLVVYLLALFVAAIGGAGVLVDRMVSDTIAARLAVAEERVREQYDDKVREHRAKIDETLLTQSRLIGHAMQAQVVAQFEQERQRFTAATLVAGYAAPLPPLPAAAWARQVFDPRSAVASRLFRAYYSNLHLSDEFTSQIDKQADDDRGPHLFQINTPFGRAWRSASLGEDALPFAPAGYESARFALWDHRFEAVPLEPSGRSVRRVVLKTPILLDNQRLSLRRPPAGPPTDGRAAGGAGRPPADGRPGPRFPPPPPPLSSDQIIEGTPRIYVMAARPVLPDEQEFAAHVAWRDGELAVRQAEFRTAQARVRLYLFGILTAGAAAVAAGGLVLVRRGLRPVSRLSDAVGRVSERDFRLPVTAPELSVELLPIHARLSGTLDQLRTAFEREKQAVADISHELRTPVASLLTTLDVALRKPRTADQYRETLVECRAITKQLGQLVERVMTLAYLDAGQTKLTAVRVEADLLAAEAAAVVRPLAVAHGLGFRTEAAEGVELDTDPDKLREVLTNLLHNAVEYNRPGGEVVLTVTAKAGRAVFAVRDTGIGMTPEVAGRVFERFYRADPSRTQTGVHAGLGLAIVKEYVDRLGGTIRVDSEPGVGSTFTVELPGAEVREAVGV